MGFAWSISNHAWDAELGSIFLICEGNYVMTVFRILSSIVIHKYELQICLFSVPAI